MASKNKKNDKNDNKRKKTRVCLNCDRPETAAPVLKIRFAGRAGWVCSQCLPVLIHHPEQLAERLPGAERVAAAPPAHGEHAETPAPHAE
jgi:hypothetical protein